MARLRPPKLPAAWRHSRLGRRLRDGLQWLRRQRGTPGYQARGLAAGVFTGCLPFFGLQIVLGVALASAMRGHPLLAAAGTWISNPLTTLPMCWLNLQLGVALLGPAEDLPALEALFGGGLADLALADLGWSLGVRLLVGSLLMGLVAAPLSGSLCWWWLQRRRRLR
ncbi:MAG: DUF2062 domain-containing protein [Cyanobium sp.]